MYGEASFLIANKSSRPLKSAVADLGVSTRKNNMIRMKYDVYGRSMTVEKAGSKWKLFVNSGEGKRREINDVVIPQQLGEEEIAQFLADIYHEAATERYPDVKQV